MNTRQPSAQDIAMKWCNLAMDMINELRQDYAPGTLDELDGVKAVRKLRAELARLRAIEAFHPRAAKLANKQKPFIVIAVDEPYFREAYSLIRTHEKEKGTWTEEDEGVYLFLCGVALGWESEPK